MRDRERNFEPVTFRYHKKSQACRGCIRLQPQPATTKGAIFELLLSLFVDDTALVTNTCNELQLAAEELHKLFSCFGLLMHVSEKKTDGEWTKSKNEALYIPARKVTDNELPDPIIINNGQH